MEPFYNQFGMLVVVRENDTLADTFATLDLQAILHQVLQHVIHRAFVVDVLEDFLATDITPADIPARFRRHSTRAKFLQCLFVIPHLLQLFPFLIRKVAVLDSVLQNHGATLEPVIIHQEAIGHSIVEFVGVIRAAVLHLENIVGALVHLVTRGRRKPEQQAVEIVEDSAELAENTTVRLVNDNQVESPHRERFLFGIDAVDHRLVGTEHDSGIDLDHFAVFISNNVFITGIAQNGNRGIRQ